MKSGFVINSMLPPAGIESISVADAASILGCSTRRVRFLLSNKRLAGFKDEMKPTRPWKVIYPLHKLKAAKRGPDMKRLPSRKPKKIEMEGSRFRGAPSQFSEGNTKPTPLKIYKVGE